MLRNISWTASILYNANTLPNNTIHQKHPQRINITVAETNGFQYSVFFNQNHTVPVKPFDDMWACTYGFVNVESGVSIPTVGLGCDTKDPGGMITWVEEVGFYEGHTGYRMDPTTLYTLIRGY
eukprot:PhF_6_TR4843/c0_g1_i5/m.6755